MSTPSLESFFSGGGGKSWSWKDKPIGTTISGKITAVNPPQQQTDPKDGSLQFKANGEPKMSVRIDLATSERDPADSEDDGSRGLYVQGWMQGAIGDALRKAGRHGPPEVGGQLSVTLTEREPNSNPVLSPINKFTATYVSPASAATGEFFGNGAAGSDPWRKGDGTPAAGPVNGTPEPARPDSIDANAWAAMDTATRQAVANTLAQLPPF